MVREVAALHRGSNGPRRATTTRSAGCGNTLRRGPGRSGALGQVEPVRSGSEAEPRRRARGRTAQPRRPTMSTTEPWAVRDELDRMRRRTVREVSHEPAAGAVVRRGDRWPGSPLSSGADRLNSTCGRSLMLLTARRRAARVPLRSSLFDEIDGRTRPVGAHRPAPGVSHLASLTILRTAGAPPSP
jgi:hypothetical protein